MYIWRNLSDSERAELLRQRKGKKLPWHRPPHLEFDGPVTFIFTAACFEHKHIIGKNPGRMLEFEAEILAACRSANSETWGWCILPNHYHLLTRTPDAAVLRSSIGQVHGRTAVKWNREDDTPGRKVWFNFFDRNIKSERHYWASLNYIHNNAVRHGYVSKWQEWPFSSAHQFLNDVGHEEAKRIWTEFPVLEYGKDWDIY